MVLRDLLALLNDHAHLEKKAASNALELFNRWPGPSCPLAWLRALAAVASDEASHLSAVIRLLAKRKGALARTHTNPYTQRLRMSVRTGRGPQELLDRLLVSALIELRSCERFDVLARCSQDQDRELSRFYKRLGSSERGHYAIFHQLAAMVVAPDELKSRWQEMLELEAEVMAAQHPGPRLHSGVR
jgi:tRNA-(ms[2]io[6]A)-hydroxylase